MRIHHIAIIALDYTRAKDFYTRVLGFEVIRETYREERKSYKLELRVDKTTGRRYFFLRDPDDLPLEIVES